MEQTPRPNSGTPSGSNPRPTPRPNAGSRQTPRPSSGARPTSGQRPNPRPSSSARPGANARPTASRPASSGSGSRANPPRRRRRRRRRNPLLPILIIAVIVVLVVVLFASGILGHKHTSSAPEDCTVDRYCDECGKLISAAHEHTPGPEATCSAPQVCQECGKVLQEALPHTLPDDVSCTEDQVCTVCGQTIAAGSAHVSDPTANCAMPQVCKYCGTEMGDPVGHEFKVSDDGLTETCGKCGEVIHRTESTLDQEIIPETDKEGHYNNNIDAYYANSVLVCGDYGMEYFTMDPTGSQSYADLVNTFARKYPDVNVTSLLIPKCCAFYAPEGYDSVLQNETDFIQSTYDMMDDNVKKADCMGVLTEHTGEYTYYRTDHHWTSLGAYYASQAFCDANDIQWRPLATYKTVVNCGYIGSLYSFAGNPPEMQANPDYTVAHLPNTEYTMSCTTGGYTFDAEAINTSQNGYAEMFMNGDQAFTHIVTENKNGKKLIIFKESYGNAFAPFMIDYFEEIIVIDIRQETESVQKIIQDYGITDALIINNVQAATSLQDYLGSKLAS